MGSKKYLLIAVSAMLSVLMSFTCFADDRRIIVGEDGLSYCMIQYVSTKTGSIISARPNGRRSMVNGIILIHVRVIWRIMA